MNASESAPRRTQLAGREVPYLLVRAKRRSVGLQVGRDGLTVRAPLRLSQRDLETVLQEKSRWILAKLEEWARREAQAPVQHWCDGASLLYRGEALTLSLSRGRRTQVSDDLFHLRIALPEPENAAAVAAAVERWMRQRAAATFGPRLAQFAATLQLPPPRLLIYAPRTLWGSCNRSGVIRLHWRLMQLPPALADYIVAHEAAHLVEMNHSQRFWAVVERLYPDHAKARAAVRRFEALLH